MNPEEVILEESPQVGLFGYYSDDRDSEELRSRFSFEQEVVSLSAESRAFVFGTFRDSILQYLKSIFFSNHMKNIKCKMFQSYEAKCKCL